MFPKKKISVKVQHYRNTHFSLSFFIWSVCTDNKAGCLSLHTHLSCLSTHILQEMYNYTVVSECFSLALLCHLLLVEVLCSFELYLHVLLAFQRVQHLCWQNSCYLRLINPYSCWEWKKIFLFAAQELCSVRSEAPLTKSVFCSSCLLQINLLFFAGIWIFFRVP